MTARTQRRVVRWNTKSEPLSIRVTLPASKDPRIRSRVGTEVVRARREIARSSGTGWTMAGSMTSAMESSPRFDGDGGIKSEAEGRDLAYRIRAIGYPVEVVKDVLRVKVDSIAQLKLRIRGGPRGTEIRYGVDATSVGWSIVLITGLISYLAFIAVGVSIAIH